jgi:hypothetical protein
MAELFPEVPEARNYVHETCGGTTVVSGDEYRALCHPFLGVRETFCATCQTYDRLARFGWADTGEPLSDYRARVRRAQPAGVRFRLSWGYWLAGLAAAAGAAAAAWALAPGRPMAVVLAIVGCLLVAAALWVPAMLAADRVTYRQYR